MSEPKAYYDPVEVWAKDYARRAGFGRDAIEVVDALAAVIDKLRASQPSEVRAPSDDEIVRMICDAHAAGVLDGDPSAIALVRNWLYAIGVRAIGIALLLGAIVGKLP